MESLQEFYGQPRTMYLVYFDSPNGRGLSSWDDAVTWLNNHGIEEYGEYLVAAELQHRGKSYTDYVLLVMREREVNPLVERIFAVHSLRYPNTVEMVVVTEVSGDSHKVQAIRETTYLHNGQQVNFNKKRYSEYFAIRRRLPHEQSTGNPQTDS